jgi:hypothetical protein
MKMPERGVGTVIRSSIFAALIVTSIVGSTGIAEARCSPGANEWGFDLFGVERARYSSTCDGDRFYAGQLKDSPIPDLAAVEIQFKIGSGAWFTQYFTGSTSYQNYNFQYSGGSPVLMRMRSATSGTTPPLSHFGY